MMNKRNFLKSSASVLAAAAGASTALAATRPSLGGLSGQASWQAHLGQAFAVEGHMVTLKSVDTQHGNQPGEQFSLGFEGLLPDDIRDGLHTLTGDTGEPVLLYLARTSSGLRADFCRYQC
ncbi:DUF6916 family protein [Pelomonas cellulosilytica]|uniref:DUF6916 domain-containing protein n=1 Tax=Pelomonas cellulosilytica TaxID=2906762 RepID=A0ABS8XTT3_9BURK|nr:hypothetical protein [Pelomonas sp. P8]MCE4554143.1 hypothetical protein [Pelomonas sp. P8]